MNSANLVGRLTKDPELKYTQSGKPVATFRIAINRVYGKDKEEADFINIVAWGKLAENTANYMEKGLLVAVAGRIQTRNFQGSEGKTIYMVEIVASNIDFLEWGKDKKKENNHNQDNNNIKNDFEETDYNFDDGDCPF